jgi:hypothetical protein
LILIDKFIVITGNNRQERFSFSSNHRRPYLRGETKNTRGRAFFAAGHKKTGIRKKKRMTACKF